MGIGAPDPFILSEVPSSTTLVVAGYKNATGLTLRSQVINPALKTLVLIVAGQSQWTTVNPTFFTATNTAVIDNFSIYDGAMYAVARQLLGCSDSSTIANGGLGHPAVRVADLLVTNLKFDRVILVPIAVGGTSASQWGDSTGILFNRLNVAMLRLASRGITPATTGVTFATIYGQGEADQIAGTSQAAYAASLSGFLTQTVAAGMTGRIFVLKETWNAGSVSAGVQAAQVAAINGTNVFDGGNMDSLNATNRIADNTHLNDTGAAATATLVYNAMHASGAPF